MRKSYIYIYSKMFKASLLGMPWPLLSFPEARKVAYIEASQNWRCPWNSKAHGCGVPGLGFGVELQQYLGSIGVLERHG